MATTVTNATLSVTITEGVSLNGHTYGNTNTLEIANIDEVFQRVIEVPTGGATLFQFDTSAVSGQQFDEDNVKYMRITNLDDTNFIRIEVESDTSTEVFYKLGAGESLLLYAAKDSMDADSSAIGSPTLADITAVKGVADTASVDCEIFVASV